MDDLASRYDAVQRTTTAAEAFFDGDGASADTVSATRAATVAAGVLLGRRDATVSTPWLDDYGVFGNMSALGIGGYYSGSASAAHHSRYQFVPGGATVPPALVAPLVYTSVAPEFLVRFGGRNDNLNDVLTYSFPSLKMDWRVDYYAHVVAMPILLTFGLVFQCLNIFALNRLPAAGYVYLKASAFADVLSIFALVPFVLRHANMTNPYAYAAMFYHAHIELPLINACIAHSTLCLTMLTVDRFLSIYCAVKCFKGGGAQTRTRIRLGVVALAVFVALLFVPSAWQRTLVPFVERNVTPPYERRVFWRIGRNYAMRDSWLFSKYIVLREFLTRILPMILITILNLFISHRLRRLAHRRSSQCAMRTSVARERDLHRSRLGWLLVITSAIFVTCNLPACLLSFYIHYNGYNTLAMQVFRAVANCIQVSHYLHYFYLYALYSSEYRRALHSVLRDVARLVGCNQAGDSTGCCAKLSAAAGVGAALEGGAGGGDGAEAYDGRKRRSTLHTPLPTTTATTENTIRSRLSSILLGQIRQYGGRKPKTSAGGTPAEMAAKQAADAAAAAAAGYGAYLTADGALSHYVTAKLGDASTPNDEDTTRMLATPSPAPGPPPPPDAIPADGVGVLREEVEEDEGTSEKARLNPDSSSDDIPRGNGRRSRIGR